MQNILRSQTYPYASTSTGAYRGLLVRKYPCWDAQGPVRDMFTNEIAGKIKNCLEQCLPESNSFVGFSLFMVGKLPEKTKPTIMIVSDDKGRRKAAFQMVKTKNILAMYPGFELGHCSVAAEFEDLRQLGSDTEPSASIPESTEDYGDPQFIDDEDGPGAEVLSLLSAEVCAFEYPSATTPTRLYFHTSPHSHSHCASATCGGLFELENEVYALTMAHAIRPVHRVVAGPNPWRLQGDSSSESDDFEITGMDDWDDDDEDGDTKTLTAITSPGSKTPSELSDSEESLPKRHDSQRSSEMSIRTRVTSAPSVIYEDDDCVAHSLDSDDDLPDACERIGSVVSIDQELDIALIKLKPNKHEAGPLFAHSLPKLWTKHRHADDNLTHTSVVIKTTHHPEIRGQRSGTPFYTRFPGTSNFLELHSVQLSASLRPGDSGSWAFDSQGEVVGFVVAGNPNSVSCLLLPIGPVLRSMSSLLHKRVLPEVEAWISDPMQEFEDELLLFDMSELNPPRPPRVLDDSSDSSRDASPGESLPLRGLSQNIFRGTPDDDTITVASSLPPSSLFSQRMDRGTPSTIAYSTTTSLYERKLNNPQPQGSVPRGNADSPGSSVTRSDFLQDQVTKLRRELERAWEIIQDKDQRLQKYITGNIEDGLGMSPRDTSPLQHEDHTHLQAYSSQGPAQTQHQAAPSEPPSSQATILTEYSRAGSPRPFTAAETKAEQARLLTLLRELPDQIVVDQICKALAFFGGAPNAPPPADGKFPESDFANGSGSVFVGWMAELFQDLGKTLPKSIEKPFARTASYRYRQSKERVLMGSKVSKAQSDKGAVVVSRSDPLALARLKALRAELETNHRVTEEIKTMWRTQVDANEALLQENAKLKRAIEQAIETTTDSFPVDVTSGDGLRRIASDLSEVLRGSDGMKPVPVMIKVKSEAEPSQARLVELPSFANPNESAQESSRAPKPRVQWFLQNQPSKPSVLYPRGAFQANTLSSTRRRIDKVVEEEDENNEMTDKPIIRPAISGDKVTLRQRIDAVYEPPSKF
ncbi:hypothetical protein F5Y07DRAFT_363982 [Xylaria sp. FL0933]|nr:hypothetical protein F5Y07DRAFT_363982 [Xylaria sp. FL0933]